MPTELQWKAIDLYRVTSNWIWRYPVQWNPQKREFSVDLWNVRTIPWHFSFFVSTFGYGILGAAFTAMQKLGDDNVPIVKPLMLFALSLLATFCAVINCAILSVGGISTRVINRLIQFHNNLITIVTCFKKKKMKRVLLGVGGIRNTSKQNLQIQQAVNNSSGVVQRLKTVGLAPKWLQQVLDSLWNSSSGEFDMMGFVMITAVVTLTIIFPIVWITAAFIVLNFIDLGIIPLEMIVKENLLELTGHNIIMTHILACLFHLSLGIPALMICFTSLPLMIVFMVIPLQIYLKCINLLQDFHAHIVVTSSDASFSSLFFEFTKFKVLNNNAIPYTAVEVIFLLFVGGLLSIGANFATLRLYTILPWYIYAVVPPVAVIVLLIIRLLLPYGIDVHEYSTSMLETWKNALNPSHKYLRRKVKSFRTLRWYAGINDFNFFLIKQSLKVGYYAVVFDYTINVLMAIPPSLLKQ